MWAFLLGATVAGAIGALAHRRQRARHDAMLLRVAIYPGDRTETDDDHLEELAKESRKGLAKRNR